MSQTEHCASCGQPRASRPPWLFGAALGIGVVFATLAPMCRASAEPSVAPVDGSKDTNPTGRNPVEEVATTDPGNAKYKIQLDSRTKWQARGGRIRFTVAGLEVQRSVPTVTTCLRWKVAQAPSPACTPLVAVKVGETDDNTGITFAVTIPEGLGAPLAGTPDVLFLVPTAELAVKVEEQPTPSAGNPAPKPTVHADTLEIGITSRWLAIAMALLFVLHAGWLLQRFARHINVPGRNVVLRIISSSSGRASLAQFQIILWTLLIGAGAVYVMTLTGSLIEISGGTLVLLGITGSALVGSQLRTSQKSAQAATIDPPGPIGAINLVTPGPDSSSACLSWPASSGGGAPVGYTVQYQIKNTTWLTATTSLAKPEFRLVGLKTDSDYDVQVFATNAAGRGPEMKTQFRTAPHAQFGDGLHAPSDFKRSDERTRDDAIHLQWKGEKRGDFTYTVEYRAHDSKEDWGHSRKRIGTNGDGRYGLTVTGLRANTDYDFRVFAEDRAQGVGPHVLLLCQRAGAESSGGRIPHWSDLVTDTDSAPEIDVARVQMLFFTVISAAFVAVKIFIGGSIPELPESFVTLMGISNGVYLSAKFIGR